MPKYIIEREIPGAGTQTPADHKAAATTSCSVLRNLGPEIQWIESYITDNKVFCVYIAPNEDIIRQHAQLGGFPCNAVREVRATINPTTAE